MNLKFSEEWSWKEWTEREFVGWKSSPHCFIHFLFTTFSNYIVTWLSWHSTLNAPQPTIRKHLQLACMRKRSSHFCNHTFLQLNCDTTVLTPLECALFFHYTSITCWWRLWLNAKMWVGMALNISLFLIRNNQFHKTFSLHINNHFSWEFRCNSQLRIGEGRGGEGRGWNNIHIGF